MLDWPQCRLSRRPSVGSHSYSSTPRGSTHSSAPNCATLLLHSTTGSYNTRRYQQPPATHCLWSLYAWNNTSEPTKLRERTESLLSVSVSAVYVSLCMSRVCMCVCECACVCKGLRKWVISSSEKHVCYAEPHRQTSCCCRPLALITVSDTNMHTHTHTHTHIYVYAHTKVHTHSRMQHIQIIYWTVYADYMLPLYCLVVFFAHTIHQLNASLNM